MDFSLHICEGRATIPFFATVQKVATYSLIPLAVVAFFEAVVKNLFFINLANFSITLINTVHDACTSRKKEPIDCLRD